MVFTLSAVVLCLAVVLFFRVPVYTVGAGVVLLVLTGLGFVFSTDSTSARAVLFYGTVLYLSLGFVWANRKKRLHVKEQLRIGAENNAREQALRQRREERLARERASAAYRLGLFTRQSKDFGREVRRQRALASGSLESLTPEVCMLSGLVTIIRVIALESDELRLSDATAVQRWARGARFKEMSAARKAYILRALEAAQTGDISCAKLLADIDSPELQELIERLREVAQEVGGTAVRTKGLAAAYRLIDASARATDEPSADRGRQVDPRYALLDLSEDCTGTELKIAYRAKAAAWHPDKLQTASPEVQQMASRRMSEVNAAYESICRERECNE